MGPSYAGLFLGVPSVWSESGCWVDIGVQKPLKSAFYGQQRMTLVVADRRLLYKSIEVSHVMYTFKRSLTYWTWFNHRLLGKYVLPEQMAVAPGGCWLSLGIIIFKAPKTTEWLLWLLAMYLYLLVNTHQLLVNTLMAFTALFTVLLQLDSVCEKVHHIHSSYNCSIMLATKAIIRTFFAHQLGDTCSFPSHNWLPRGQWLSD